jgi:hypothetical protein
MSDPVRFEFDVRLSPPDTPSPAVLAGVPWRLGSIVADLSAGLDLPAVTASAEHFGASMAIEFHPDKSGNLLGGFLQLEGPTAVPPSSVTLALASPMPGGGRLEKSGPASYRGAIGVDLGVVVVAGFASVQLEKPLSIAAILSATFRPPIQLSFGFTLVGVGGAIGINRRVDRDGLSAALSSGELGNMLFPRDPVGEADRILPALDRCFPVSEGDFFVGPMLKLGWGTPTIISATLAVIVGTDGVAIIGTLRLSLPCEDAPFAVFNVTILGIFDAHGVSIDGSLVNSRIGPVTIDGDARFRLTGGDNGTMALSVGGFHPAYTPPAGMAGMRRLRAEMSPLPFASMRLEGYTALTTDSVQFGGAVAIRADLAVAGIDGHASFDAIIYFSPFRFRADFHASLALELLGRRIAGVSITAHFSGPGHWELVGSLTIEILWWDVDVHIELEWGDPLPEPLATDDPVKLVALQLQLSANWTVDLRAAAQRMVVLANGVADQGTALSPIGVLNVVQMASPLGTTITRVGGLRLASPLTVTIAAGGTAMAPVTRGFPGGMFFDRDKVSLDAGSGLVPCQAGAAIGDNTPRSGVHLAKDLDFEDCFLDPNGDLTKLLRTSILAEHVSILLAAGGAARKRDTVEAAVVAPRFVLIGADNG